MTHDTSRVSRYYHREHFEGYARIRRQGLDQWSDLHEQRDGYADFPSRRFLDRVAGHTVTGKPAALVYGGGTGASACYLAERGYAVEAVDLVPDAVAIARERAERRGLSIDFAVVDVCDWPPPEHRYDLVLDDFCLQSIVTDADRSRLYSAVAERLTPGSRYVINCAIYEPGRTYRDDRRDDSGIVWVATDDCGPDTVESDGRHWLPHRRHLDAAALRTELEQAGFTVLDHRAGEIVCALKPTQ